MTDERNVDGRQNRSQINPSPAGDDTADAAATREEWLEVAADPDPSRNLGYEVADWEEYPAIDGTDQVMFVPAEESLCERDAFVVVDADLVCETERRC